MVRQKSTYSELPHLSGFIGDKKVVNYDKKVVNWVESANLDRLGIRNTRLISTVTKSNLLTMAPMRL